MASRMIGRTACPECGFAAAHVKESDKCAYRYCPECGSQHHARTERQKTDLLGKTRLLDAAPTPTPTEQPTATPTPTGTVEPIATATPEPTASTQPKAPAKRGGLFF